MPESLTSELKAAIASIESTPISAPITIIATGKFIGEGFDVPRLDTLFLTMPISWKGTLQQYTGRLHRLWDNKHEVRIYDYIDIHILFLKRCIIADSMGMVESGIKLNHYPEHLNSLILFMIKTVFIQSIQMISLEHKKRS